MFKTKRFLIAALAMVALSSAAQAGTISASETTPATTNWNKPYEFTYNLTGADGFKANSNFFTSANLALTVTGDKGNKYTFGLGHEDSFLFLTWFDTAQNVVYDGKGAATQTYSLLDAALADLNADGKLSIFFKPVWGDNMKIDSVLTASFKDKPVVVAPPASQVPEPTSIALLGLGLLGMTQMRKRKA